MPSLVLSAGRMPALPTFSPPPAQVRHAVFQCADRQTFGLPALQQGSDMLALERGGPHLAEACFAQLASGQNQRPLSVGLGGMAAVAVALAKLAQGIGQVVHRGVVPSVVGAEKQTVSVFANSPRRDPRRARARCSVHLWPRMRRPPCFLWEGQAEELQGTTTRCAGIGTSSGLVETSWQTA